MPEGSSLESIKFFATLGVGGILAGTIFWFYRKDMLGRNEYERQERAILLEAVKSNTAAMQSVKMALEHMDATLALLRERCAAVRLVHDHDRVGG
jgi:cbb3-type cytochrome oxidase subunit 3